MSKIVLITGATSGIGEATAKIFAKNNYNVIITGRRKDRLETLKNNLLNDYNIECKTLHFDVQDKNVCLESIASLEEQWKKIDILINNAGLALGRDSFEQANLQDWDTMIDTNIKGLLYMSKAIIPLMVDNQIGHIINIGSTAGKEVYENGNVYCATKHAVDAISKAQRIDLLKYGIKVSAIHPGAVETEFSQVRFKGDDTIAKKVYDGFTPLQADDIASTIYYVASLPKHVCINDLIITCTQQANSFYVFKK